jgi:hypothetical protein
MSVVNIIDEVFIVADPALVRTIVCDGSRWSTWLPGTSLSPYEDRGALGMRWTVSGELTGTAEVWLEEHGDGVVVHSYLRADPAGREASRISRSPSAVNARYALPLKRAMFEVKDRLEGNRQPGSARVPLAQRVVSSSVSGQVKGKGKASDGGSHHVEHSDRR